MEGFIAQIYAVGEEEGVYSTLVKGVKNAILGPSSRTYLDLEETTQQGTTRTIPSMTAIEEERGNEEEEAIFRRSSLTSCSSTKVVVGPARLQTLVAPHDISEAGSFSGAEGLRPTVQLDRLELSGMSDRSRRASIPVEVSKAEGDLIVIGEDDILTREEDERSEASSSVYATSKASKRSRGNPPEESGATTATDGESGEAETVKAKRRKRRRPRTTNIIDIVRAKEKERKEAKEKERKEWEDKRMANPNLIISPAMRLPSLEDVIEELENQPIPDITSEVMQTVHNMKKEITTAKNLKGTYVNTLRKTAFQVHASINVLAHRMQESAKKDSNDVVVGLRRKIRSLYLEQERMSRELEEAANFRKEEEKKKKENEELRRKIKKLEEKLQQVKERCIEEMGKGNGRTGGNGTPQRHFF